MSPPLRIGLVGLGTISQRGILPHLQLADARELIDLQAICDVNADRAAAIAADHGVPHWYSALDALLLDAPVDAILIATPIPFHHPQALAAIRAGKHVYVQKTMTTTLAEANELIAAASSAGITLAASPGQMLSPAFARIRQLIVDGAIGRPYWALTSTAYMGHEHDASVDPTWYYQPGGGPVYDMGVYSLHALTGVLGPAKRVTAMSGIGSATRVWHDTTIAVQMDDNTILLLDFGASTFGVASSHYCDSGNALGWGFFGVYGTGGAIEVTQLAPGSAHAQRFAVSHPGGNGEVTEYDERAELDDHLDMPESHVWLDIRDFAEAVRGGREPRASANHARHVIEIVEAGYVAAHTGQAQELTTTF